MEQETVCGMRNAEGFSLALGAGNWKLGTGNWGSAIIKKGSGNKASNQLYSVIANQTQSEVQQEQKANKKIKKKRKKDHRLVARIFIVGCRSPTPVAAFIAIC